MKIVIFTDLDATLLDPRTYSWKAAEPALEALKSRKAAVVLVSSKTMAEMAPLHSELGLNHPFIVENGGGIVARPDSTLAKFLTTLNGLADPIEKKGLLIFPLGARYDGLVRSLKEMSREIGIDLVGFSSLSDAEISELSGLNVKQAALARDRDFDEPFLILGESEGIELEIQSAAKSKKLTAVEGGRFWHLIGHDGKGTAVSMLITAYEQLYGRIVTIGLGDSPNDFPFMELVDIPVLVRADEHIWLNPPSLTHARQTRLTGTEGWNEAVLEIVSELERD